MSDTNTPATSVPALPLPVPSSVSSISTLPAQDAVTPSQGQELVVTKETALADGPPLSVDNTKFVERDRVLRAYSPNDLPLTEILEKWRAIEPLSSTAKRKRLLLIRTLELFKPERLFSMSVPEFRAAYMNVGNAPDAMKVLADMSEERLICYATHDHTYVYGPSVQPEEIKKARVWLTADGVRVWAAAMVDLHREKIRADQRLSGLLTQFLVELTNATLPKNNRKT